MYLSHLEAPSQQCVQLEWQQASKQSEQMSQSHAQIPGRGLLTLSLRTYILFMDLDILRLNVVVWFPHLQSFKLT